MLSKDLFEPKKLGPIGPVLQIIMIAALFGALTAKYYFDERAIGNIGPGSTFAVSLLFVPIYEELIFRGILLGYLENVISKLGAVVLVSILFGFWHVKNIFWFEPLFVARQIAYTTLIFSPVVCVVTLRCRSIWPAVVIHFLNNLIF